MSQAGMPGKCPGSVVLLTETQIKSQIPLMIRGLAPDVRFPIICTKLNEASCSGNQTADLADVFISSTSQMLFQQRQWFS
ncbi:hypothetical protein SAMN05443252_104251 [Bacillus sp. OV322]|nr:hypothetical protein SAMN05443252_104251 [Bacillus sp. OV322]